MLKTKTGEEAAKAATKGITVNTMMIKRKIVLGIGPQALGCFVVK